MDKSIFCCIFAPLNKKITKTSVILINDTNHKSHTITLKLNSMKKIFTLIAMALMTVGAMAEDKVWDFSETPINTLEAIKSISDYPESPDGWAINEKATSDGESTYTGWDLSTGGKEAIIKFTNFPLTVSYTNKDKKTEFVKVYASYFQIGRQGVKLTIACNVGDEIHISTKSYSKSCLFTVIEGGEAKKTFPIEKDQDNEDIVYKATTKQVIFDTNTKKVGDVSYDQACQITKISIVEGEGGDEPEPEPKIITVSETENKIVFENVYAKGELNGYTLIGGKLELSIRDTDNKLETSDVTSNVYFGTPESYVKVSGRLKTGGKSSEKLALTLKVGEAGKLNFYGRSGASTSDNTPREFIISADGAKVFGETLYVNTEETAEHTDSEGNTSSRSIYPVYSGSVEAGEYSIEFPDGGISIYAITLGDVFEPITTAINTVAVKAENSAIYNALGQRVNANAKGIMIQNGKKFIAK